MRKPAHCCCNWNKGIRSRLNLIDTWPILQYPFNWGYTTMLIASVDWYSNNTIFTIKHGS